MLRKALARWPGADACQKTIVVDLTPYPAAACNGVDADLVCDWLRALVATQPQWQWTLLTAPGNHHLFAAAEAAQMRRRITPPHPEIRMPASLRALYCSRWRRACTRLLRALGLSRPPALVTAKTLLRYLAADVLFCPFGATHYHDCIVPAVVVWNDLAHLHCPHFLEPADRDCRTRTFRHALHIADKLVCFSGQAKAALTQAGSVEPRRVISIRLRSVPHRSQPEPAAVKATLEHYGLLDGRYFLYPAAFTESNNHKLLLVACGMFKARFGQDPPLIVCSGPARALRDELGQAAAHMGLGRRVRFVATDSVEEQTALLQACRAVLFPTLEGTHAVVLLHALELNKPILCSSQAPVPDLVRDAAFSFDAKRLSDLVHVLQRATNDEDFFGTLSQSSRQQAKALCSPRDTAMQLIDVLQEAMATSRRYTDAVKGIHPDGWTSERIVVTWSATAEQRWVRLKLRGADWLPWSYQRVSVVRNREHTSTTFRLRRGQTMTVEQQLPAAGGHLEFLFDPPARPSVLGVSGDDRLLGCYCTECAIVSQDASLLLHTAAAVAA
jgi:glycosyltransferase involved in cell wall biosynthesis